MTTGETEPESPVQPADRLNRWLTLAANIGVLLGLFVLIIEVRQNAQLTRAVLETEKNDQLALIELSLSTPAVAEAWTKAIRAPETLTDAEVRMVESHMVAALLQWDNMFQLEAAGLASRSRVQYHIRNIAPFYFGSEFGQNWWRLQEPGWGDTPMYEVAGPIVEAVEPDFLATYLDKVRAIAPPPVAAPVDAGTETPE